MERRLVAVKLSDGTCMNPAIAQMGDRVYVRDFCLDEDGNLYHIGEDGYAYVAKYSLTEEGQLWKKMGVSTEIPFYLGIHCISYTPSGGLFIQGMNGKTDVGGIHWIDPEEVGSYQELIDLRLDLDDPPPEIIASDYTYFAVDHQYRIYYAHYHCGENAENPEDGQSLRSVWILEPEAREADPADAVTLTVTWSELLDLALQWKEEGTDLSLMTAERTSTQATEESMLRAMLLANLYDAEQPDGTVQLDQPYLRELLEKWSQLHDSTQLVRGDGVYSSEKALMAAAPATYCAKAIWNLASVKSSLRGSLYLATRPKGEVNKRQQGYAFCWGVSAFSKQQDEAWALLEYLIRSDSLPSYSYSEDTIPVNTAAQENWREYMDSISWSSAGISEAARAFFDQMCALQEVPYSRLDEPSGWTAAVYDPIQSYINGKTTLDEAMKTTNANWERFLLE